MMDRDFIIRKQIRKIADSLCASRDLEWRAQVFAIDCYKLDHDSAYRAIKRGEMWLRTMLKPEPAL